MSSKTAVVFTAKSIERILKEGGTSSWRLDRNHARQCEFAVCTRNAHADWVEGPEAHHAAFLVGKVSDVVPASEAGRYLIQFSEYALVTVPDAWKGDRNPIKYADIKDLGIDPAKLKWRPMPEPSEIPELTPHAKPSATGSPLTMAEAKKGLALTFGVKPEAIEITIRG
jgi:hypothetical protein